MTHALDGVELISLREDTPKETPDIDDLLSNATNKIGREIQVPKVVG